MTVQSGEVALVEAAQRGDREAFATLANAYRHRLSAYLFRSISDRHLAEDLLQEALIKIWQNLGRLREPQKFSAWVFRIAHRAVLDHVRVRDPINNAAGEDLLPRRLGGENPEQELVAGDMEAAMVAALRVMPDRQRDVFLLRLHGTLSFKEIAAMRDEPLSTVLGHMANAVARLKAALREYHDRK